MSQLAVSADDVRITAAADHVLEWATSISPDERSSEDWPARVHASQQGNVIAACSRIGIAKDPRVETLVERLIDWQWPDGGWNCDLRPGVRHSSFHETITPAIGLAEYHLATGHRSAGEAANRCAQFFLKHRMFRSERNDQIINPDWLNFHYPPYYWYDILQGLILLARLGPITDSRADEALILIEQKRRRDGTWSGGKRRWRSPGAAIHGTEAIDWGRRGMSEMTTLEALKVLQAAGRFE